MVVCDVRTVVRHGLGRHCGACTSETGTHAARRRVWYVEVWRLRAAMIRVMLSSHAPDSESHRGSVSIRPDAARCVGQSEGGNSPGCGAPCCIYARDSLQPSYGRFAAAGRAARFVKCGLPIQPRLCTPRMLTQHMLCDSAGIGRRGSGAGGRMRRGRVGAVEACAQAVHQHLAEWPC